MGKFNDDFKKKIAELYAETQVKQGYLFGDKLTGKDKEIVEQIVRRENMIACLEGLQKEIKEMVKGIKYEQTKLALEMSDGMRGEMGVEISVAADRVVKIKRTKAQWVRVNTKNIVEDTVPKIVEDTTEMLKEYYDVKELKKEVTEEWLEAGG